MGNETLPYISARYPSGSTIGHREFLPSVYDRVMIHIHIVLADIMRIIPPEPINLETTTGVKSSRI